MSAWYLDEKDFIGPVINCYTWPTLSPSLQYYMFLYNVSYILHIENKQKCSYVDVCPLRLTKWNQMSVECAEISDNLHIMSELERMIYEQMKSGSIKGKIF
jgi:hypothetical protein